MTQARSHLIPIGSSGSYHCVQRCVRRAYLCGIDHYTQQSFEHRKAWVQARIALVGECFSVAIYAFAVMSNHLHLVLHVEPSATRTWSDEKVAQRWVRLFPPRVDSDEARMFKQDRLIANPARLALCRTRLGSLSWFMKCLAEPIARQANAEDGCKGRFWEGRFKSQVLCDDKAVLAAMAYVDLNPIRADMTSNLLGSDHTSIQKRILDAEHNAIPLTQALTPLHGTLLACLPIRLGDYVELVEWTGRQVRADKRGAIPKQAPSVLKRLHINEKRWTTQVKGIGSRYWRVVGDVDDLLEKAKQLNQRWLKGIGTAMVLAKVK
jgi:REP element-mobilizing transposase RayT